MLRIPELAEQSVLITGAARGLGLAMAVRLARLSATVGLVDIDAESVAAAAEQIRSTGGRACAYTADVSNQAALQYVAGEFAREGNGIVERKREATQRQPLSRLKPPLGRTRFNTIV